MSDQSLQVHMETSKGVIVMDLLAEAAPEEPEKEGTWKWIFSEEQGRYLSDDKDPACRIFDDSGGRGFAMLSRVWMIREMRSICSRIVCRRQRPRSSETEDCSISA